MKITALFVAIMLLSACAATDEQAGDRTRTAIADFIEVNELVSLDSIRTVDQLSTIEVSDQHFIVSTRRDDFLLEHARCVKPVDGRIQPDYRKDLRTLYARADTYRGCYIKAIYALEPGQADEIKNLGVSVGGDR